MTKYYIIFIIIFFASLSSFSQTTREEYISKYKDLAIREMKRSGIPASITMAQALLESDNGNSALAKRAKNHFGIKCHGSWDGKKYHQDDDNKDECFRKYNSVEDSYKDHTEFLKRERYAFLYDLKKDDYKGWARGLKKAGYATNRKYPQLLISIIEENNLSELDKDKVSRKSRKKKSNNQPNIENPIASNDSQAEPVKGVNSHSSNSSKSGKREILLNNRVKYIIVREGDTFDSINKELDLLSFQLPKYNEISEESILEPGSILYIQPKRKKAERGKNTHRVVAGETLYSISQKYAIKRVKLMEINLIIEGQRIKEGDVIYLRKKKL